MKKYISFFDLLEIDQKSNKIVLEVSKLNTLNIENYNYFLQSMLETILNNFLIKNKTILLSLNNTIIREYTIAEIYVLLVFLKTNIEFNININKEDLVTIPNMTSKNVHEIIEILLQKHKKYFKKHDISYEKLADIAADIIEELTKLSITFSWIAPTSISLYDIIQFAKRDHIFNKLINMKLNDSMSIKEIERMIPLLENELKNTILKDKKNCLYQYIATGTVKLGQVRQMFTPVGTRMDVDKTILPYPIKGNFLNGLQDVVEAYAEAVVARNALIDKDKHIKDAGYESRKIDLNNIDTYIHPTITDCHTKHYLTYTVESEADLRMLKYKYQILDDGSLREIDINNKKLIGKTIKIRSHIYCALEESQYICQTCYGANSDIVMRNSRVGCFPSSCIQNLMSDLTISSKHYQDTNAAEIDSKTIKRFFNLSQDKCFLKTELDYSKTKLVIEKLFYENMIENINNSEEDDEYDMSPLDKDKVYIEETAIDRKSGEVQNNRYYFDNLDNIFLYLSSEIFEEKGAIKFTPTSDVVEIHLGKVDLSTPIIDMRIVSEGIVYQVRRWIEMIDSKTTESYKNPDLFLKDIISILKDVKINTLIQHVETLMYNSVRDANNYSLRPDFHKDSIELVMLSIKDSIMYKDVYTSLSFEKYNNQLKKIDFFNRNLKAGAFLPFFRTTKKFM